MIQLQNIIYIVYIIIALLRLNIYMMDKLDKDIIYYLLMTDNSLLHKYRDYFPIFNNVPSSYDSILLCIIYILYIPIIICYLLWNHLKNLYLDIKIYIKNPLLLSKGMAYNAIIPYLYNNNRYNFNNKTFNKIYWYKLFKSHNILTPSIVGTVIDKKIKLYQKYKNTNKYILKPKYGCCGSGIVKFNKNNIPDNNSYIIQSYIKHDKTYRIITNSHFNTIQIIEVYCLFNNNNITTNISTGGNIVKVNYINSKLKKAVKQAKLLHKSINRTYKCNTIGWDVIITDNIYFLEGNIGVPVHNENYIKYVKGYYKNII